MHSLSVATGRTIVAFCIVGAIACGDDDDRKAPPVDPHDGGLVLDGGQGPSSGGAEAGSGLDGGGLDSGLALYDAAVADAVIAPVDAARVESDAGVLPDGALSPCLGGCRDAVDCTVDTCVENRCVHTIDDSVCSAGSSCDLKKGCQLGVPCANGADCADSDGCTFNERCDPTLARCVWDVLDRDLDGDAPVACGGTDCDDANGLIGPGVSDTCDAVDNDCDGTVDEAARCGAGRVCMEGDCICGPGFASCGIECVDFKTDADHCGECGNDCGSGGVCTGGACSCPATATLCGETCTDTKASLTHCGACDAECAGIAEGGQFQSCLAGACTACGRLDQPCCRVSGCGGALTCQGTQGAADSKRVCGPGAILCDGVCVDPGSDEANCGACGKECDPFEVCLIKGEVASCAPCGSLGEACCDPGLGVGLCVGGAACGLHDTCVRRTVPAMDGPAMSPMVPMSPAPQVPAGQ